MKTPERACRLQLDIQADTRDEMVRALEGIATAIERGEMSTGCSGGVHSGWLYAYVENASPSHEEYQQQLKAYLAATRAAQETPAALDMSGQPMGDPHPIDLIRNRQCPICGGLDACKPGCEDGSEIL